MSLRISATLSLPDDYVTKTAGILAQRRKGKTYTACVLAEEMVRLALPFVALDPTGAWWGLRANADGRAAGLPVIVLGGQHGDVPLERSHGALVADLVVDNPGWYVLDLSLFGFREAEREFATAFAERLYRRKGHAGKDSPLHLFVDEADLFVPQQSPSGDKRMLGAFESLVRRGGLRGIGTTLISQRSAVVNKNVLEQLDMLIVLRTVGPRDREKIEEYVEAAGSKGQTAELMGSLASLAIGEAWVWEPGAEPPIYERIRVRERLTYNSSATPKTGERKVEPRQLAAVDLDALKVRMAESIERHEAEDPKKLQARIRELERQAAKPAKATAEPIRVVVPMLDETAAEAIVSGLQRFSASMDALREQLAQAWREEMAPALARLDAQIASARREVHAAPTPKTLAAAPEPRPEPRPPRPAPMASDRSLNDLPATQRILVVLARSPDLAMPRRHVAARAAINTATSTLRNSLSSLRRDGLIESGELLRLTLAGIEAAGGTDPLPTGDALVEYWRAELGEGAARRIFDYLVDVWPASATKESIIEACEIDGSTSTFRNAMSRLRSFGLVPPGPYRADDDLMEAAR